MSALQLHPPSVFCSTPEANVQILEEGSRVLLLRTRAFVSIVKTLPSPSSLFLYCVDTSSPLFSPPPSFCASPARFFLAGSRSRTSALAVTGTPQSQTGVCTRKVSQEGHRDPVTLVVRANQVAELITLVVQVYRAPWGEAPAVSLKNKYSNESWLCNSLISLLSILCLDLRTDESLFHFL